MRQLIILLTVLLFVVFGLFLALVPTVSARSEGISGYSGNPATNGGQNCNVCHSGGVTPVVTLSGPDSVEINATNVYTLTISGGQESHGGFDVSADGGTLDLNEPSGTQLLNGEVVHSESRPVDTNNEVVFTFLWQAPAVPGTVMLYGAGNSVNNGMGNNGDRAATDTLTITVSEPGCDPTSVDVTYNPLSIAYATGDTGKFFRIFLYNPATSQSTTLFQTNLPACFANTINSAFNVPPGLFACAFLYDTVTQDLTLDCNPN